MRTHLTAVKFTLGLKTADISICFGSNWIKFGEIKILNNITFTNYRLAKIGYVPNDLCTFCGIESETVNHLYFMSAFSQN